ncbi:MAG: hypothetical protein JXP34_13360 [Planctomycetes bacterium]|nr:hypothetical protein [Planctomycetota bacterium]
MRQASARLVRFAAIAACLALVIWGIATRRGRRSPMPSPSGARTYLAAIESPDALLREIRAFDARTSERAIGMVELALRDPDLAFGLAVPVAGGGKRSFVDWLKENRLYGQPLPVKLAEALLLRAREGPSSARAGLALDALAALSDRIPETFAGPEARALVRAAAPADRPRSIPPVEIPAPGWIEDLLRGPEWISVLSAGSPSPPDAILLASAALARAGLPLPAGISNALAAAVQRPSCGGAAAFAQPALARIPDRAWDAPSMAALLEGTASPDRAEAAEAATALHIASGIALGASRAAGSSPSARTPWRSLTPPPEAWLDPRAIAEARLAWGTWWQGHPSKDPRDALLEGALSGSAPRDRAALWELEVTLKRDRRAAGPWLAAAGQRLEGALSSARPSTRRAAARILGIKGDAGPLVEHLRRESERDVREEILRALASASGDRFPVEAIALAENLDEETAWQALDRLVLAAGREAGAALLAEAFREAGPLLRARVAAVLPRVGPAKAAASLLSGLADPDAQVRFWCDRSLRDLAGGLDVGYRPGADAETQGEAAARWRREAARRGWIASP